MAIDPILSIGSALSLTMILVTAAVHKWQAPALFARQVADYELLPQGLVRPVALLLPVLECLIALGLLAGATRRGAAVLAALLVAGYAAGIGINLLRGRNNIDCGCSGPGAPQPLHPSLLLRNLLLAGLALLAVVPVAERPLGLFDGFVTVGAIATVWLLYIALDTLLANRPRLLNLIGK